MVEEVECLAEEPDFAFTILEEVHRENMPKGMDGPRRCREPQASAEGNEGVSDIPPHHPGTLSALENVLYRTQTPFLLNPKTFPQFRGERLQPLFVALAEDVDDAVVEVHRFPTDTRSFTDTHASIEYQENEQMQPALIHRVSFPHQELVQMLTGLNRHDSLCGLQLGDLEGISLPLQIGVDTCDSAVECTRRVASIT